MHTEHRLRLHGTGRIFVIPMDIVVVLIHEIITFIAFRRPLIQKFDKNYQKVDRHPVFRCLSLACRRLNWILGRGSGTDAEVEIRPG